MDSLARGAAGIVLAALVTQAPLTGAWALPDGKALATAHLQVTNAAADATNLAIVETSNATAQPIRDYDLDMTKLMHLIVVSDDFSQFMHVHPAFDAGSGRFTETVHLDPARRYYVYADTDPKGLGQQVFRFTLGNGTTASTNAATPSARTSNAGAYTVALSNTTLAARKPQQLTVTITSDGKLANGLQPYLGAAAHAVFIDTSSLAYVHVHPTVLGSGGDDMAGMNMGSMKMAATPKAGPRMTMDVPALAPGTYKLWLEFRGKAGLATAPFTLVAQ